MNDSFEWIELVFGVATSRDSNGYIIYLPFEGASPCTRCVIRSFPSCRGKVLHPAQFIFYLTLPPAVVTSE